MHIHTHIHHYYHYLPSSWGHLHTTFEDLLFRYTYRRRHRYRHRHRHRHRRRHRPWPCDYACDEDWGDKYRPRHVYRYARENTTAAAPMFYAHAVDPQSEHPQSQTPLSWDALENFACEYGQVDFGGRGGREEREEHATVAVTTERQLPDEVEEFDELSAAEQDRVRRVIKRWS